MFVRGGVEDLESVERKVEILNAISELFGGKSDAVSVAQAIENISEVVQPTKLIEKTVTTNGEYSASADDADGYSKVTVNVVNENNARLENTKSAALFTWDIDMLTFLSVPEGFTEVYTTVTRSKYLKHIVLPSTLQTLNSMAFTGATRLETITINKPEGSIAGAPWDAPDTTQVIWTG